MKNIEEIIRRERGLFDDQEPPEGHAERFSFKLATRLHARKAKKSIVPYLLRAAVVILLVTLSSLWTFDHFVRPNLNRKMTLSQVSPEYREAERYYVREVSLIENEITTTGLTTPEQEKALADEMAAMDSVYTELQKELRANPNDQRIIDAMIKHYQTKLEVLNYILVQLKELQAENVKTVSHEKIFY